MAVARREIGEDSGHVAPEIVRGEIPVPKHFGPGPRKPAVYAPHRELARHFPPKVIDGELVGGWVLCAEQKTRGQGPKERHTRIMKDRRRLAVWLDRAFPLERYQIAVRIADGTVCDRVLYMRWIGDLTPEQNVEDRKRKRANYEKMLLQRQAAQARRELKKRQSGAAPK